MGLLDFVTIVFFSVGIVCVGMAFSRKGKDMKSFFAAGGAVPWQMSGLSLFMGFFSAGTFVVWGSVAYNHGWVSVIIQWTMAIAGFVVGTLIAPRWHRTGSLTVAEYINKRLGITTQKAYTYLFLFISLFLTASFLYPVAKIVEVSTGFDLNLCIILLGIFCILYVSAGGLWAVVSTDILQFVILIAAIIIVVPLSVERVDGISNFITEAPTTFFEFANAEYSVGFIIAFGIYNTIFLAGNWAYVQRFTSVRTEQDSRKVGWLFGALYFVSPILWMLPPMIYHICNPSLGPIDAEGAYLMMCKEVLPKGLLGLMIGGMIFATTSAMNSKLNIASGVFTNDIFKRLRPKSSDRTLMLSARLSTIGFGVLAILLALMIPYMGGVVNVVISLAALTGVPLYLPVIWTLFSKRQTGRSVVAATILSLVVNGFFKFVAPELFDFSFNRAEEMIFGVAFPILCMIVLEIYFIIKNKISNMYGSYKIWEDGNQKKRDQITEKEEQIVNEENKYSQKVIGYGVAFTGIAIAILGIIAPSDQLLVAGTGLGFALLGLILVKTSALSKKNKDK